MCALKVIVCAVFLCFVFFFVVVTAYCLLFVSTCYWPKHIFARSFSSSSTYYYHNPEMKRTDVSPRPVEAWTFLSEKCPLHGRSTQTDKFEWRFQMRLFRFRCLNSSLNVPPGAVKDDKPIGLFSRRRSAPPQRKHAPVSYRAQERSNLKLRNVTAARNYGLA